MINIKDRRFNHVAEHYVFTLENGDEVLIHERELESDMTHESTSDKHYRPIFEETASTDDITDIIGFIEIK